MRLSLLITFISIAINCHSQNIDSLIASLYFNNGLEIIDPNGFDFDMVYSPTSSSWAIDSFSENVVFKAELSYENPLDPTESYQIRIGKGGQLYSFRSSFGESVPPQFRPEAWTQPSYGGGTSYAPWVDEVWQMVCVDGALNNPPDSSYFIHQAGVYLKTPSQTEPFFSPVVAEYYNPEKMSYTIVNWGQQAHTEDLQNINHKSSLLYYTTYTNKGNGIIQVDNMIYNFGQDNISFLNMPWGGVRNSSLDHFFISTPNNDYNNTHGIYGASPVITTANTGGWVAWSNDTLGNTPALGMVHPITTNTNGNVFRYGDAGNLSLPWNERDYHVFEMIRFPAPGQLGFGKSMSFRYFYVLGANVDALKNTIISENLVSHCLDTAYIPIAPDVDSIHYLFQENGNSITTSISNNYNGLLLRTSPFLNSYPLFKITSASNNDVISSDPYYFSEYAYDGSTSEIKLLGFIDNPSNISFINDTICSGEEYLFPDGSSQSNILLDSSQLSYLPSNQIGWDSLIITNLVVINVNIEVTNIDGILESDNNEAVYQWLDCDDSYNPILGETNQNYFPNNNGNFAVQITQNGCVDTSACNIYTLLGVIENDFGKDFSVYPNPTNGDLSIDLGSRYNAVNITISDINGKLLQSKVFSNTQLLDLKLKDPPGIYLLRIISEEKKAIIRIVKK